MYSFIECDSRVNERRNFVLREGWEFGSISAMYGSQSRESIGRELFGSFNLYLGMENLLKLFNTSDQATTATVLVNGPASSAEKTVVIPANGTINLPLRDNSDCGTAGDSYGGVLVTTDEPGKLLSEVVRIRHLGEELDFAAATSVR